MKNSIKKTRIRAGRTQQELADYIGVNVTTIHRWEQGLTNPTDNQWRKLAKILRKSVPNLKAARHKLYVIRPIDDHSEGIILVGTLHDAISKASEWSDFCCDDDLEIFESDSGGEDFEEKQIVSFSEDIEEICAVDNVYRFNEDTEEWEVYEGEY